MPPPSRFCLAGRTAFISGGSSGIGLHTARVMAEAGAAVILAARRRERVEEAAASLCAHGHTACAVTLDVTRPDTIAEAWNEGERQLDRSIDLLFNNAGVLYAEKFVAQRLDEVERIFDTNLKGAFLMAQLAASRMSERGGGAVINVASTAGLRAGGQMSSYGAAKAGLIHLSAVMALELAGKNVRVNVLCPGNMKTDMQDVFAEKGFVESLLKRIPMRRFGDLEQLDGAILLLASDAGSYMTGSVIVVDGGQSLSWM